MTQETTGNTLLVVGADKVDGVREGLARAPHLAGLTRIEHWSGRRPGDSRRVMPAVTGLVLVICTQVSHELLHHVNREVQKRRVPVLYCRHSLGDIRRKFAALAPGGRA